MSDVCGFHYDDCCVLECDPVIWQECTDYAVLHDSEDLAAPVIRVDDDGGGKSPLHCGAVLQHYMSHLSRQQSSVNLFFSISCCLTRSLKLKVSDSRGLEISG
jgi:hypothetical protein